MKKRLGILVSLVLILSLILSGCGGSGEAYVQQVENELNCDNYYRAMQYLKAWEKEQPRAVKSNSYKELYGRLEAVSRNTEPENGHEFYRSIASQGGCRFSVTSTEKPLIIYLTSLDGKIEVSFYVRAGQTASVFLPADMYRFVCHRGELWLPNAPDGFGEFKDVLDDYETLVLEQHVEGQWTSFSDESTYI